MSDNKNVGSRTDLASPATRADFEALESRLEHIEAQNAALRAALEANFAADKAMRAENREVQQSLRAEFRAGIAEFKLGSARLVEAVSRLKTDND